MADVLAAPVAGGATGGTNDGTAAVGVLLGVDVGTTGVKVAAFGLDGHTRHVEVREYPLLEPEPGHQVQDPAVLVAAVVEAVARCVAAVGPEGVVGLSLSAAMHGLVGTDAHGTPTTPLLTWADGRAADLVRELRSEGVAAPLHRVTGTPVHPMSPLVKLAWFRRHEPLAAASVARWLDLKALVVMALTGTAVTDLSSASGSGLLDMATGDWSPLALGVAGVGADRLPFVLPPTHVLPLGAAAAAATGLPAGTPVVLGAADGPLGNVGTGAVTPGSLALSLGTSGAVRMVVPAPPRSLDPALFCYALTPGAWVVGGAVSNGGIVARWLARTLLEERPADDTTGDAAVLALAAQAPPGSDGLVMLPYLLPERSPLWDADLTGAYLGLRRRHTRAHLARAALEGVAMQVGLIASRVDAVHPVRDVTATGGTLRSPLWQQLVAAALGRPMTVAGAAEGTARGAAVLGLVGLGIAPDLPAALGLLRDPLATAEPVQPVPELVVAAARARSRAAELLASLDGVRALLAAP
ncbi:sugar kinase [Actinotalea ferrariae CF5-4]|uniref:Sugar kinase n=1 Tax=Actinotalea ferrariae CF5-4 TaxID=948458 RepID=A0A021VUW0_9CELL|nr:gluconokinase [Actinotalea ferrariae]EYR64941.1 sugar kinase [Actinotalea ferrariae CF5-4]